MPNRIPIRLKLMAALAIPIAALLVVATLEVIQSASEADEVRAQTDLAKASIGPNGLISNLQHERNYGSTYLIGFEGQLQLPVESFEEAKARTDASMETFLADIEGRSDQVKQTYAAALEAFETQIDDLRATVENFEGERNLNNQEVSDPVFQGYTDIISAFFQANTQVALAIDDPTLRRGAELTDLASRQTDAIARLIRTLALAAVSENGLDQPDEISRSAMIFGEVLANQSTVRSLGNSEPYVEITQRLREESDSTGFVDLARESLETGQVDISAIFDTVSIDEDFSYYGFRGRVEEVVTRKADDLMQAANARRLWFLALAVLAIVVALAVTWLVSRSITRPLRSLTRQAKEMAERRLPDAVLDILETPLGEDVQVPHVEPVRVSTRDEVADVAEALNTVQDSALDLAVEQAVLRRNIADSFVNLGRRNQNLLGRQLDFITELESNETDPDTLASLFRLDHLATRMRRNAESLLVLAGIDPPRKWAAPVRLTDVIRAALGEVEDYQRVTVRGVEPATILGAVAADLAHLIAEFVENALTFSPPDQTVDIRGRHRSDTGGYTLAIIDSGLGMPPADLAQANRRLAGTESFTVAPSKYLGHYVAGNLAARHGIHIQLENSPGNGITATVDIPPTLLTTETPTSDPITDPHGTRPIAVPGPVPEQVEAPPPVQPPPPPAPEPARTASGLVKRSPRQPAAQPTNVPDDDLLATLSGYTRSLPPPEQRSPVLPGTPGPMSSLRAAGTPPSRPAPEEPAPTGLAGRPPAFPQAPQAPRTPPRGPGQPPEGPPLVPAPGDAAEGPPPGAVPPAPPLPPRAPDTRAPGDQGAGPVNPAWTGLAGRRTGQYPVVPGQPPTNGDPGALASRSVPPQPPLDPSSGGTTPSGLARRVRGAQMPTTQPLSLRRSSEHAAPGAGGYGRGDHRAATGNGDAANGDGSPAKDVYSFLSSFTAGVQRGLDEARRDTTRPEEES